MADLTLTTFLTLDGVMQASGGPDEDTSGDVAQEVTEFKKRFSREVQIHGSCGLAQTLIEGDLIDEYRLLTFPVILGTGKRLFGVGTVPRMLTLVRSSTTSKGAIVCVYRRGGSLKTGSFALD